MSAHCFSRPLFLLPLAGVLCLGVRADPREDFRISVVDADTGRGVPLVELRTTNDVRHVTHSNGIVASGNPELMRQQAFSRSKVMATTSGFLTGLRDVSLPLTAKTVNRSRVRYSMTPFV